MGTRNLTLVVLNKEIKVAQYGQWDGYLSGQGKTIAQFLAHVDLPRFKQAVSECRFVTDKEIKQTEKKVGILGGFMTLEQSEKFHEIFPSLNRDHGAGILEMIDRQGVRDLQDRQSFATDSLFCEWGYLLDLDKKVVEVYRGFQTQPVSETERFAKPADTKQRTKRWLRGETQYHAIKCWKKIPFKQFTMAKIKELKKILDKEGENEE
ncbi:MAG: hypothetical protein Q7S00_00140 [bacterium]|nr:hypothetical protein [bacterium]